MLFLRRSPLDRLRKRYERLLQEAHQLSTSNRRLSDEKAAEAAILLKEIEAHERLENTA